MTRRNLLAAAVLAPSILVVSCTDRRSGQVTSSTQSSSGRSQKVLDVMRLGAVGDGATDDTEAIQRALDQARGGGTVHFPPGVYRVSRRARDVFLEYATGTTLTGAGMDMSVLRPLDRAGEFRDFLRPFSDDRRGAGIAVSDIGFDMNSRTNPIRTDPVRSGMSRCVIRSAGGPSARVTVTRCRFTDCSNVNTLYVAGLEVAVTACEFTGTGARAWLGWDHSSVYAVARSGGRILIEGNAFRGTLGSGGSRTAIETHGGNQTVRSNRIDAYMVGMNITGVAEVATDGVDVSSNSMSNGLIGVQVWSQPFRGSTARGRGPSRVTRNVGVRSNALAITADSWRAVARTLDAPACGVLFNLADQSPLEGMSISGNHISYLAARTASVTADERSAGISFVGTGIIRGLSIVGNQIIAPLSSAVLLDGRTADVVIRGNTAVNPGSGSQLTVRPGYRALVTLGGTVDGLSVSDNVTYDNRTPRVTEEEVSPLIGTTLAGKQSVRAGEFRTGSP